MKLWLSSLNLNMLLADNTILNKFDDVSLGQTAIIEQMNGSHAPVDEWRGIAAIRL